MVTLDIAGQTVGLVSSLVLSRLFNIPVETKCKSRKGNNPRSLIWMTKIITEGTFPSINFPVGKFNWLLVFKFQSLLDMLSIQCVFFSWFYFQLALVLEKPCILYGTICSCCTSTMKPVALFIHSVLHCLIHHGTIQFCTVSFTMDLFVNICEILNYVIFELCHCRYTYMLVEPIMKLYVGWTHYEVICHWTPL